MRAGPALGAAEHDHRPGRALRDAVDARRPLNLGDLRDDAVHRVRHQAVHRHRVVTLDEVRLVAEAAQHLLELHVRDAREHRRARDLVAVEVQDRQHRAVARRAQEFVGVPARRERPRLGLAVADDRRDEEPRVVERRAERVRERVAELAALVQGAGHLGRDVARDAAWERELLEQALHPDAVERDARIELAVGALEVGVRDGGGPAVTGTGDVDAVEVVRADHSVEVREDEVEAGRRAPVPEQARLDVLCAERLTQERVITQVDLPNREIICCAPVGVEGLQRRGIEGHRGVLRLLRAAH